MSYIPFNIYELRNKDKGIMIRYYSMHNIIKLYS